MRQTQRVPQRDTCHVRELLIFDDDPFVENAYDSAAWKLEVAHDEMSVLQTYLKHLLQFPDVRHGLGIGGWNLVKRFTAFEKTASMYLRMCDR